MILNVQKYSYTVVLLLSMVYSLNLHGLSHIFENQDFVDDQHCELCIINHQKTQSLVSVYPICEDYTIVSHILYNTQDDFKKSTPKQISKIDLKGQLFNRPPPPSV